MQSASLPFSSADLRALSLVPQVSERRKQTIGVQWSAISDSLVDGMKMLASIQKLGYTVRVYLNACCESIYAMGLDDAGYDVRYYLGSLVELARITEDVDVWILEEVE